MQRSTSIIFFLLLIRTALPAQPSNLIFDHYGPDEGFTTRTSRSVVKTSNGIIWISTNDGIASYDSKKFRFYTHNSADSNSLTSDLTDEMIVDSRDDLWLVAGEGLDRFNTRSRKVTHCSLQQGDMLVKNFSPEALYYDKALDRIWVSTRQGLYFSTGGSTILKKARAKDEGEKYLSRIFHSIVKDRKGYLWLGNTYGFFRYEPESGEITRQHVAGQDDKLENDDGVFCLYADNKKDILWIGTWTRGLFRYDMHSGDCRQFLFSDPMKEQNGITFIAQTGRPEEDSLLCLSATGRGFSLFNTISGTFSFYSTKLDKDKSGIRGLINRMLPTETEGLWIASENGLHRYDHSKQLFGEVNLALLRPELERSLSVTEICFYPTAGGKDSLVWINIPYSGLYRYDHRSKKLVDAPPGLKKLSSGDLYAVYMDSKGILWCSTSLHGLTGYDDRTGKFISFDEPLFRKDWHWVNGFFEDKEKNLLWLSTYNGLYVLQDGKALAVDKVNKALAAQQLPLLVTGISKDRRGMTWFCVSGEQGQEDAVGMYDPGTGQVKLFHYKQNGGRGFPRENGLHDLVCVNGHIYVATPGGLLRFSSEEDDPLFEKLTVKDGLINNYISQVIVDRYGQLWCSTNFGVSCYLPEKGFFINYSYTGFALGQEPTPFLSLSPNSGTIWIGQHAAVNFIQPKQIQLGREPGILFTSLLVNNEPLHLDAEAGSPAIRLKHYQNMIAVEFATLSFSNSSDNQYAWKLEGLEKEWNSSKTLSPFYANLSPGTYTLLVRAASSTGVWVKEPAKLKFIIRPPFWKTWWFWLLCLSAVVAVTAYIIRQRFLAVKEKYFLRNKIAIDLHDEIGSTLTSIHILSNVSQQALQSHPAQAREMLEKISQQSKTIQQNMSDIVWAIRPDNDRIGDLVVRMREYAAQTLEPLGVQTMIRIDEQLPGQTFSLEARKNVLLIFKEAVNNIAKHSGADEVTISMEKESDSLQMIIHDNGTWKTSPGHVGTGTNSMQQRAKGLGGSLTLSGNKSGTTVSLLIPIT